MNKQLANKLLVVLVGLLAFRVLAYIGVPGVNTDVIKSIFNPDSPSALGIFNMFSGGAAERFSIISLGIMPYITASIVMELIAATFPAIGKLKKERDGMVKYMQIIRYATIFITIIQAVGVSIGLQSVTGGGGENAITIEMTKFVPIAAVSMLAGTMLLLWIGEQITKHGVGQGVSLIIFAGIVSGIPVAIGKSIDLVNMGTLSFLAILGAMVVIVLVVGAIIFVELGERRIPISYSRKVVMQNQNKRIMNYVPVKINLSGVIPPIFASAVLMFPATILQALQTTENSILTGLNDFLSPNGYFFHILMFLLVVFFAYFYASITFNAKDISENLKKQGGFIPGVRPGASTAEFLNEAASRLTFFGSIYLAIIATIPWALVQYMGIPFYFGGTAVLIVVQVALDTMRKIEAQIYMSKYETLSAVGL
ncbi:MAG: preprotein translocase subunit SecY [Campylobacteraceae bacterium]|jgi:preprotein translocase subunit SecY|nr:preprotein translocase subunit SecY [Campylobacteraceae bacterium]